MAPVFATAASAVEVLFIVVDKSANETGEVLDPHTAIGVKAARECRRSLDIPMVILGTAHPVKFPEAVEKAGVGKALELPVHLTDLFEREERCTVLANDLKAVQAFVSQHGNRGKPL